jgi:hypothetical protein
MRNKADVSVYDAHGQLVVLIEVKKKFGTSKEWAAKMRRNIIVHGSLPYVKYFLLALPDHFYLWKDVGATSEEVMPTYDVNPTPFLQPYYEKIGLPPEQLSGTSFEMILTSWLGELQQIDTVPGHLPQETQRWLQESGLLDTIKGGRLAFEEAA